MKYHLFHQVDLELGNDHLTIEVHGSNHQALPTRLPSMLRLNHDYGMQAVQQILLLQ